MKPDAAHIVNHRRLVRLVHLAPQPPHMNVDEVGLGNELVVPHLLQQHRARQHLLLATHHVFEQPEFARQQIDVAVPALGGALDKIELERPCAQAPYRGSLPAGAIAPRCRATSSTVANGLVR